jgi:hypothetical protein
MMHLRRWLATWSDGNARVIHAHIYSQAFNLAHSLTVPIGVYVVTVEELQ